MAGVTYRFLRWGDKRVPLGVRSLVGVLFMVGGVFGFFPLLGFWMFPLGLAFVALDIPWTRHRIHAWMEVLKAKARPDAERARALPLPDPGKPPN